MATGNTDKKIALVTGANKGIGLEIARQLAQSGYTVLVGARDEQRSQTAAQQLQVEGVDALFLQLDVTNQQSIDLAAQTIEQQYGRLDVLVNNAAIAQDNAPPSQLDIAIMRRTYETNVFGLFAITKAMLPLLRKADKQ